MSQTCNRYAIDYICINTSNIFLIDIITSKSSVYMFKHLRKSTIDTFIYPGPDTHRLASMGQGFTKQPTVQKTYLLNPSEKEICAQVWTDGALFCPEIFCTRITKYSPYYLANTQTVTARQAIANGTCLYIIRCIYVVLTNTQRRHITQSALFFVISIHYMI